MRSFIFLLMAILSSNVITAQIQGNIWVGGENGGVDFNGDTSIAFFRPENSTIWRTSASICNNEGHILFYTNGFRVFNRNFELLKNGDSLNIGDYITFNYGFAPTPDGAIIIPIPNDTLRYYIFYMDLIWIGTDFGMGLFPSHLFFAIVDISLDSGYGAIQSGIKDIPILNDTLTQFGMQAVKHGNGRDWWLVCQEYGSNRYYKFLIDDQGIHGPYSQSIGIRYQLVNAQVSSPMKFSRDGSLFVHQSRDSNIVELFDFNRCSGELSNYRKFQINDPWVPVRGVSLSPSERYLYLSSNFKEILQFDLQSTNINQSRTVVGIDDGIPDPFSASYYLHQLGPDGKIYITSYDEAYSLHVINSPDSGGLACNFVQRGFPLLNGTSWFGGVPNIPNLSLGSLVGSECDTLTSIGSLPDPVFTFGVYPNPFYNSSQVSISGATNKAEIFLYNTFGQLLYHTTAFPTNNFIHQQLPVKNLVAGMYLVKVEMGDKRITQKLVKR